MSACYAFEWSVDSNDQQKTSTFGGLVYENDRRAISAALIMFRNRTADANDELAVYEGRKNGWGGIEEGSRYVGKVAYNQLGSAWQFFKASTA